MRDTVLKQNKWKLYSHRNPVLHSTAVAESVGIVRETCPRVAGTYVCGLEYCAIYWPIQLMCQQLQITFVIHNTTVKMWMKL